MNTIQRSTLARFLAPTFASERLPVPLDPIGPDGSGFNTCDALRVVSCP